MTGGELRALLEEAARLLRVMGDLEAARYVQAAAYRFPATDDPNAPCRMCRHVLVSHTPPTYLCRAIVNDTPFAVPHPCDCPRFVTS